MNVTTRALHSHHLPTRYEPYASAGTVATVDVIATPSAASASRVGVNDGYLRGGKEKKKRRVSV
jgi:hypothetical protein